MEVIRQHRVNPIYVAKHNYGLNDYEIRSPTANITFRHRTFIWLAFEKNMGIVMENTTRRQWKQQIFLLVYRPVVPGFLQPHLIIIAYNNFPRLIVSFSS
jgi:hypothetical protein